MHNFIGFILNIKDEQNLWTAQKALAEISKQLEKDDLFYITGNSNEILKKEFDASVMNYQYKNSLANELSMLGSFTKNFYQFKITYYLLNDNSDFSPSIHNKLPKLRNLSKVIIVSKDALITDEDIVVDSFQELESIFKENYGTH